MEEIKLQTIAKYAAFIENCQVNEDNKPYLIKIFTPKFLRSGLRENHISCTIFLLLLEIVPGLGSERQDGMIPLELWHPMIIAMITLAKR